MAAPDKVAEFIELRSPGEKHQHVFARAELHYEQGRTIAIYTDDQAEARELDKVLWTLKQNSFIPHVRAEEADGLGLEPVLIVTGEPQNMEEDVLILASADELPSWAGRFAHIYDFAEVYDEERRTAGRRRFSALKAAGYRMRFAKLQDWPARP